MPTRFLNKCGPIAFLSLAVAVTIGVASLSVNRTRVTLNVAHAKATPTPAVVASAVCRGTLGASTDNTDFPSAPTDMTMTLGFETPGVSPANKSTGKSVSGVFALAINGSCEGVAPAAQNPCPWAGSFSGTLAKPSSSSNGNEVLTLSFGDLPGAASGSDILDGCSLTFLVQPYSKNTSAALITSSLVTGSCHPAGSRVVLLCTANNE